MPETPPIIDLVLLGDDPVADWPLGRIRRLEPTAPHVSGFINEAVRDAGSDALLFWDPLLGRPSVRTVERLMAGPCDAWHAGLLLGAGGLPQVIDFVTPTWQFNRDPDPQIESTSWRLSLRACLIRKDVLRRLGGVAPDFQSLEAAALDLGHRMIHGGALVRHVPSLLPSREVAPSVPALPPQDEFRFALRRFGRKWTLWATIRALLTGTLPGAAFASCWFRTPPTEPSLPAVLPRETLKPIAFDEARVSVLIPTLDRYPYLRTLLDQLRTQTVKPHEVIVVDQTPASMRDEHLARDFGDLPLTVINRDAPGQCSSRNAGLRQATGDYILLADDDIEIEPSFIEDHLATIRAYDADSSSGIAYEPGSPAPSAEPAPIRVSGVFPAGITLVRRAALMRSGLFDLAYEHGPRADGDLGMRIYLAGGLMVLNPGIAVLHHRAPRGGLRTHGARVTTMASSRSTLMDRHLPAATEIYLARRHFSKRQCHEANLQRIFGTFSLYGSVGRRLLKALIGLVMLPHTLHQIHLREHEAERMLHEYPQIAHLRHGLKQVLQS